MGAVWYGVYATCVCVFEFVWGCGVCGKVWRI
jgi:hypothetical protein